MDDRIERGEHIDQYQLITLWAWAVWMPGSLIHLSPAHWEAVDAHTARLVIPFGDGAETITAHFDPTSGRMTHLSGLRYDIDSDEQEPWRLDLLEWKKDQGIDIPSMVALAKGESGSPNSYWTLDGVVYNVNVDDQLGAKE
jgi:hypothetical protein